MSASGYPGPRAEVAKSFYEDFVKTHGLLAFLKAFTTDDFLDGTLYRSRIKNEHPEWEDKIRLWEVLNGLKVST